MLNRIFEKTNQKVDTVLNRSMAMSDLVTVMTLSYCRESKM